MNLDEVKRIKKTGAVGLWSLVLLASILHLTTLDKVFNSCWYFSEMVNNRQRFIFSAGELMSRDSDEDISPTTSEKENIASARNVDSTSTEASKTRR